LIFASALRTLELNQLLLLHSHKPPTPHCSAWNTPSLQFVDAVQSDHSIGPVYYCSKLITCLSVSTHRAWSTFAALSTFECSSLTHNRPYQFAHNSIKGNTGTYKRVTIMEEPSGDFSQSKEKHKNPSVLLLLLPRVFKTDKLMCCVVTETEPSSFLMALHQLRHRNSHKTLSYRANPFYVGESQSSDNLAP
jgi:hypothetical protein